MEKNVVSSKTAEKLKEAGYPQDQANYGWVVTSNATSLWGWKHREMWTWAAPAAQEIADALESRPRIVISQHSGEKWTAVRIWGEIAADGIRKRTVYATAGNLAEALALLWIKIELGGQEN